MLSNSRLRKLNDLLNQRIGPRLAIKSAELLRRLGCSLRQLRTEIKELKRLKAPLVYDPRLKAWFYSEGFVLIEQLGLTQDEHSQLRIALEMFTAQKGLSNRFGQLAAVAQKIEPHGRNVSRHLEREKVVFFDPLPNYEGAKHLPFFLEAIEKDWKTAFDYKAYTASVHRPVIFEPYFLRQWDGRWYTGGQSLDPTERDFIRVYPLERIVGQPRKDGFAHPRPENFSPESYWANLYGITNPREDKTVEEVVLRFSPSQAPYFLGAPFFQPFDTLEKGTDGSATVRLFLKINIDLLRKLASYGRDVEVLGPPRLIEKMGEFFGAKK